MCYASVVERECPLWRSSQANAFLNRNGFKELGFHATDIPCTHVFETVMDALRCFCSESAWVGARDVGLLVLSEVEDVIIPLRLPLASVPSMRMRSA